jgi:hypothetical protein
MRRRTRIALLLTALASGVIAVAFPVISREVKRDSCADNGGVWLAASERCVCTYSQRGVHEDVPTPGQLGHRAECELKPKPTDWTDE